jgi:hypothetical protein
MNGCPEPGCVRAPHTDQPTAHVKYGATVDDARDRAETRVP